MIRLLVLLPLLAGGCVPDVSALANDPNAFCIKQTSIYESLFYDHNWGCENPPVGK